METTATIAKLSILAKLFESLVAKSLSPVNRILFILLPACFF